MTAQMARKGAAEAQAAGNQEEYQTQTKQAEKVTKEAYAKLRYEMQHFVDEATKEQLSQICQSIAQCAARAQKQEWMRLRYMETDCWDLCVQNY